MTELKKILELHKTHYKLKIIETSNGFTVVTVNTKDREDLSDWLQYGNGYTVICKDWNKFYCS